jgi:hypothetical protein
MGLDRVAWVDVRRIQLQTDMVNWMKLDFGESAQLLSAECPCLPTSMRDRGRTVRSSPVASQPLPAKQSSPARSIAQPLMGYGLLVQSYRPLLASPMYLR